MPIRPAATVAAGVPYFARGGTDEPYDFDQPTISAASAGDRDQRHQATCAGAAEFGRGCAARRSTIDLLADFNATPSPIRKCSRIAGSGSPDDLYAGNKNDARPRWLRLAAGGVNGPGPGAAGINLRRRRTVAVLPTMSAQLQRLYNGTGYIALEQNDQPVQVPVDSVAVYTARSRAVPAELAPAYACQNEKPIFSASETEPVPFPDLPHRQSRDHRRAVRDHDDVRAAPAQDRARCARASGRRHGRDRRLSNDYLHTWRRARILRADVLKAPSTYAGRGSSRRRSRSAQAHVDGVACVISRRGRRDRPPTPSWARTRRSTRETIAAARSGGRR